MNALLGRKENGGGGLWWRSCAFQRNMTRRESRPGSVLGEEPHIYHEYSIHRLLLVLLGGASEPDAFVP